MTPVVGVLFFYFIKRYVIEVHSDFIFFFLPPSLASNLAEREVEKRILMN